MTYRSDCPWCGEAITEAELTANGCDSCGETIDPYPEPPLKPVHPNDGHAPQLTYPCPDCGNEASVYHNTPDDIAWCERCGEFDVSYDADHDGERFVDRTTLSPRIPRRSIA